MTDTTRRKFLGVVSLGALLSLSSGTVTAQEQQTEPHGFRAVPLWFGEPGERPAPESSLLDSKTGEVAYLDTNGRLSHLTIGDSEWTDLPAQPAGYSVADLPTDVGTGSILFDENRGVPTWWDRDHYERPTFVDNQDVLITPQTVENTTVKTEVFSIDFNPDSMVQGRVYQLDLMGTFGTANTSDQFTIVIDLGGTEIATLQNAPENATNAPWSMETTYTVRSHGESGVVQPHSRGVFNSVTTDDHHSAVTVDTTVTESLAVSILWDAADPDNTVTLGQAHLKQMA